MKILDLTRAEFRRRVNAAGYDFAGLLAKPTDNPKVAKNLSKGVLTAPLHLAPANVSGYEVCPMRSAGCSAACLHTAGAPQRMAGKSRARKARTRLYFENRALFMGWLIAELRLHLKRAQAQKLTPGVRLNATSDIPWERVGFEYLGTRYSNVMELFPEIQFYDYTKRANRTRLPSNYHLTFSLAEDNDAQALEAIQNGMNVAAVIDTRRGRDLPPGMAFRDGKWITARGNYTVPIVDGDEHDYRPADPRGVIVGLRAKGDAIGDQSGFVREAA